MTARVIAEENDEYAEHVAAVSDRLASHSCWTDKLAGQSLLDRSDLSQVMALKGWQERSDVHSPTCDWSEDPGGEPGRPACCGRMCTCLRNAAYNEWSREVTYGARIADGPDDEERYAGETVEVADSVNANVDLHRALSELPDEQRAAVWSVHAEGNTLEETATDLGVPLQTIAYRQKAALEKLRLNVRLLLAALPD